MTAAAPATVEEALVRDVLESPHDDFPRLVLADWWEEHGQEERAEFVRVQCAFESARRDESPPNPAADLRLLELAQRERELRATVGRGVLRDIRARTGGHVWTLSPNDSDYPDLPGLIFCRGFVEHVRMPCAAFLTHARALFSAQPVLRVTLADKRPRRYHPRDFSGRFVPGSPCDYAWYRALASEDAFRFGQIIPAPLFHFLLPPCRDGEFHTTTHPSEDDAMSALSRACVAWGRAEAGLSPLPG